MVQLQLVLIAAVACAFIGSGRCETKQVRTKGRITCDDNPAKAKNIKVKLVHEIEGPVPDQILDETTTDEHGEFVLSSVKAFERGVKPFVQLDHTCVPSSPDDCTPTHWKLRIPQCHVTGANEPTKQFDLGTWELKSGQPTLVRDCIVESTAMTCKSTLTVHCKMTEGHQHQHETHDAHEHHHTHAPGTTHSHSEHGGHGHHHH